MTTTQARAITYVWIILSAITIVSWFLGPAASTGTWRQRADHRRRAGDGFHQGAA